MKKPTGKCIDCSTAIWTSHKQKRCKSCSLKGSLNPWWNFNKIRNCKRCDEKVSKSSTGLCQQCYRLRPKKIVINKYLVYKGEKFYCVNCGVMISQNCTKCRLCFQMNKWGANNPNWREGKTKLQESIRKSSYNEEWKNLCKKRDNYTCQECKQKGGWIEIDHIKPFALILYENKIKTLEEALLCKELWELDNGRVLCHNCHLKTKTYGKGVNARYVYNKSWLWK